MATAADGGAAEEVLVVVVEGVVRVKAGGAVTVGAVRAAVALVELGLAAAAWVVEEREAAGEAGKD